MDREPKERVIFDESVYYGDAGEEIAIESLMASEDLTEAEVRAAFIDSQIFERAMEMMDRDRTVELEGLSAFDMLTDYERYQLEWASTRS